MPKAKEEVFDKVVVYRTDGKEELFDNVIVYRTDGEDWVNYSSVKEAVIEESKSMKEAEIESGVNSISAVYVLVKIIKAQNKGVEITVSNVKQK